MIRAALDALRDDPGRTGLYLFAATLHGNRALAVIGCLLMLYPMLRRDSAARAALPGLPLYRWLLLLAIYVLLRAIAAMIADPAEAMTHGDDALRFVYFVGVLPVAWHLAGNPARVLTFLAVALAGFVAARLWHLPEALAVAPEDWLRLRPGLGLEPIGLGYYAGSALLGVLLFLPRLIASRTSPLRRIGAALAATAIGLFLGQCVIWSQSRGAWLSLLPCVAIAIGWLLWSGGQRAPHIGRGVALSALLVLAAVLLDNRAMLQTRFLDEQSTLGLLLRGDLEQIRSGDARGRNFSIGTRVNMLRTGLHSARKHPLFGAGPAAPRLILAGHPDPVLRRWNDFHNAPVDLLVRFGAVGLLLVAGGAASTAACGVGADFRRSYPPDLRLFLWLCLALLVLSSLSNFRLLNWDWRYWLFVVAGAMASPRLAALRGASGHSS